MRGAAVRLKGALALAALAVCCALVPLASPARGQVPSVCLGDLDADQVEAVPGPALRYGITPAGEAGALGPAVPAVPGTLEQDLDSLALLRPQTAPFVLRLNRFFWSLGEDGIRRFEERARSFTEHGYLVELQLRYHPTPDQEGDIAAWTDFVREVVRRFGPNRRVIALQVTNEVNFTISPDSSDGAYAGARDALIEGVKAAHAEAASGGYDQLEVGFNWFYRTDPADERSFWEYLRDHGGPEFIDAVDWVGLDAYPGTVFPPVEPPGGERDGMVNAMSQLRECFLPVPGIGAEVPIHVEENGYPTGPGRTYAMQEAALRSMVGAVHDFRGTYNVSDYRWFDLRDHDTASLNLQHHYGLLEDDYTPKPAFAAYAELVRADSPAASAAPAGVVATAVKGKASPRKCRKKGSRKKGRARKKCRRR
jgi:hypothetical protein